MERLVKIVELEEQKKAQERGSVKNGEVIGPALFKPLMKLGKGSFGEVYAVMKLPERKIYAMKVLHKRKIMG